MNRLDCHDRDRTVPVVGICLTCGAAICQAHAGTGRDLQDRHLGSGRAPLRCRPCSPVRERAAAS
ncbi:hypothetical protein [Streptomyces albireticuli]|uniref:DUF2180 family protein n=1 Tax=Streptomyces albireticuli TaxID=1940 RepID=A0A2A2D0C2_9ACTN|nr:hypothetical protein [Streptomyces albireticuli]MCD9145380.1 hypothetical protein [Streptomyces albireticuli]MCD9165055.1 hypothetical protein [Streptomyces albireticuli]MCD9195354.1 hypothetical protein [Streptomyces albireticuli]PAU44954.1 hypothetical protein CK936_32175 [Streptomyces albireticuli]